MLRLFVCPWMAVLVCVEVVVAVEWSKVLFAVASVVVVVVVVVVAAALS